MGWHGGPPKTLAGKKQPKPLSELRVWWKVSAVLNFGVGLVDGLLERARAAAVAIRAQVRPWVDTALAAIDVAAVVYVVRGAMCRDLGVISPA